MSNFYCSCRNNCTIFAALASLIIGVVTAFLRITAVITVAPAFLWVVLGVAIVYLGLTLLKADALRNITSRNCGCSSLNTLFTGILGSVLTSVILLAITFAATSIVGALITGALLFFFTLTLTSTVCLVKCNAGCDANN